MTQAITIKAIRLQGFRAFLEPQEIVLQRGGTPLSLALFAPNAKGKSSLVDALEFFFSEDATLSRLGTRSSDRQAGRRALEHVEAQGKALPGEVTVVFQQGTDPFQDTRPVTTQGSPLPEAARRVLNDTTLTFILRGHELRKFVEETSHERYLELVKWFGLEPLLQIQRNLHSLRREVKKKVDSKADYNERIRDIGRITGGRVGNWDEATVCQWLNETLVSKLDNSLSVTALADSDPCYQIVKERKQAEDKKVGLTQLGQFVVAIGRLKRFTDDEETAAAKEAITEFESAVKSHAAALRKEDEERSLAREAVFEKVWAAARGVFDNDKIVLDACPVCDTRFSGSPLGSRSAIALRLDAKLTGLAGFRAAGEALQQAKKQAIEAHTSAKEGIARLVTSFADTPYSTRHAALSAYLEALNQWDVGREAPSSTALLAELKGLHRTLSSEMSRIRSSQGEGTYAKALSTFEALFKLKSDLQRIQRRESELTLLNDELDRQSMKISRSIMTLTETRIGKLRDDINALFAAIQGPAVKAPRIRLELPKEEEKDQQRVHLLVDFTQNRTSVAPSGYLSDSQLHTLALSLRLTAIKALNKKVPVIVLDDVVTSYDVDHRAAIAKVLATHFDDFQVIVATHDERFFNLLKDRLPPGRWSFRTIAELRPAHGPCFLDHKTTDEMIEGKLDRNESAANDIRQAQEEWLLEICRAFRVEVEIRPLSRPFEYGRAELAQSLARFLKSCGLKPPKIEGVGSPFLTSLQRGDVENFGSHFSDNPNLWASVGDETIRWNEFKSFRDAFVCQHCGCTRFTRPAGLNRPVCANANCQQTFAFAPPEKAV